MTKASLPSIFIAVALVAVGVITEAQQPKKVSKIGFLIALSPSSVPDRVEAFRQGLRDLGYVEGQNVAIEWRSAEGNSDLTPLSELSGLQRLDLTGTQVSDLRPLKGLKGLEIQGRPVSGPEARSST